MLQKGIVAAVHPYDHSVDVVLADGRRLTGVQVVTPNGSTRTGVFDMPAKSASWDVTKTTGQDQIALVGWVDGVPLVLGFLYPQVSQMTFNDPKRRFNRHQSDVYTTIDGDGNMEIHHPNGTYIRIAEDPAHEDLSAKNSDKNLGIDRNTGKRVHFHLEMGGNTASIDIEPDGQIVINTNRDVIVNAQQDADVRANGNASVVAKGWGQFVGDGPVLIKSETILKLKGPSGELIL